MKIRLALVDSDEDYRKRLSDFYIKNYHDRIEIMAFSSFLKEKLRFLCLNVRLKIV